LAALLAIALPALRALAPVDRAWILARNSLVLAAAVVAASLPVGTLVGWLLARTDLAGRRLILVLFGLMLFVPLYLQAAAWQAGFGLQGWCTLAGAGTVLLEGWPGVVWIHVMAAIPWVVLIAAVGFRAIDPELEELSLLDASPARVFWSTSLPAAWSALGTAAIWVAIVVAGEMTVTDLFAKRTYAEEVYTRLAIGAQPGDPPLGLLPGGLLTAALVVAGLAVARECIPRRRPASVGSRWVFRLGVWHVPALLLVGLVLAVSLGIPLGNLAYKAGVLVTQTDTGRLRVWSPLKCLKMVAASPWAFRHEWGWSLLVGSLAATTATIVGTVLAWQARRGRFWAGLVVGVSAIGLAVPGPVLGLAIIGLLNQPGIPPLVYLYDYTIAGPWLAWTARALPPATLIVWQGLATIPAELLDAAAIDGAGPVARLVRIALPQRLPSLAVAWLVGLAVASGDLAASILVIPPGMETLSRRVFGLIHYGIEDQVAGICLAQVVLFGLIAAAAAWLWNTRSLRRRGQSHFRGENGHCEKHNPLRRENWDSPL
jgi:iron(III) transport system permease protein